MNWGVNDWWLWILMLSLYFGLYSRYWCVEFKSVYLTRSHSTSYYHVVYMELTKVTFIQKQVNRIFGYVTHFFHFLSLMLAYMENWCETLEKYQYASIHVSHYHWEIRSFFLLIEHSINSSIMVCVHKWSIFNVIAYPWKHQVFANICVWDIHSTLIFLDDYHLTDRSSEALSAPIIRSSEALSAPIIRSSEALSAPESYNTNLEALWQLIWSSRTLCSFIFWWNIVLSIHEKCWLYLILHGFPWLANLKLHFKCI